MRSTPEEIPVQNPWKNSTGTPDGIPEAIVDGIPEETLEFSKGLLAEFITELEGFWS